MSNNYSLANMGYAIRKLEQEVQGLINQRELPVAHYTGFSDELDLLKKQFEKLNSMLVLLQTSAQNLVETGVNYQSWKQSSNVYNNVLKAIAEHFFIGGEFQNGLTRTYMTIDDIGRKIAIQGANTLCGDTYELCVIYKNGLAKNVIPNKNLIELWNKLVNDLSNVLRLGTSLSTQSFAEEVQIGESRIIIQNGTIGGYQKQEHQLEQYCMIMWKLCQAITMKIDDYKIGGFGTTFGQNINVAVNQCSLGAGVSLAPYNTCAEIFNAIQAPLTCAAYAQSYPFNGQFTKLTRLTSLFTFNTTSNALLKLFTCWNPFVEDQHTLVGSQSDLYTTQLDSKFIANTESTAAPSITGGDEGQAFARIAPVKNSFDNTKTILTYSSTTNPLGPGIYANLYFKPEQGINGSIASAAPSTPDGNVYGPNYGRVSGKIVVDNVGFNFVGMYTNVQDVTNSEGYPSLVPAVSYTTQPGALYGLYQLGGRLYYA